MIQSSMNYIELYTCIRFAPRTYERDFVEIISDRGCWSSIGKIGQKQQLSLQKGGCFYRGIIMHELIHALGYDHMQNHSDRDKYVIILESNITPDELSNFEKDDLKIFSNFGTPYGKKVCTFLNNLIVGQFF
jgi:Astacin (Peptidase family M12A)